MATNKSKHLENVLESHRIKKEKDLLDKHTAKRDTIKEEMEEHFGSNMYPPFNSGSLAKNTAVNTKFDIDLMSPFKRNAFGSSGTLKDMYDAVYKFLHDKYHGKEAIVRKQKVSVGIEFYPDADGHVVRVDVVPGRELNQDEYKDDKRLNLYVYEQFGKIGAGADHLRSNIHAQIDHIKDRATKEKDSIRKIIRLLKTWKINKGSGPKSFFLELITIKAFDTLDITGDLWEKLKAVMEYIRDNVKDVSLPDPGNSGNDVADTMSDADKTNLSNDMKYMIDRIEEDSDNIKLYFKVNPKHPCEDDAEESTYKIKKEGVSEPPPARFG
ncbi:MAG: nucleotidyltransferase [Bacteroidia bacterium]|nr:nucleotidyltransferase [Bacteroidia bacterium]